MTTFDPEKRIIFGQRQSELPRASSPTSSPKATRRWRPTCAGKSIQVSAPWAHRVFSFDFGPRKNCKRIKRGVPSKKGAYGCGSKPMVPFWSRCTPIFVYFSGDWDVHWGYDLDFDTQPYSISSARLPCLWICPMRRTLVQACREQGLQIGRSKPHSATKPLDQPKKEKTVPI